MPPEQKAPRTPEWAVVAGGTMAWPNICRISFVEEQRDEKSTWVG